MKRQLKESAVVVADLFREMELTVTAYGPGAVRVGRVINGTAFFPGGTGLWRGVQPRGESPSYFPASPVMVLGHNFDKVAGHEGSCKRGIELMNGPTWHVLLRYLERAGVEPSDCFFTNVFVVYSLEALWEK